LTDQVPAKAPSGTLSSAEGGAWGGFLRAHATVVRKLDAELKVAHGLPLSSYEVLLHLSWAPGHRMRMGELAESVLLTLGGVTRLISRLDSEELVRREPCPEDRRGAYAILTELGLARLNEAHPTSPECTSSSSSTSPKRS
jgi:DNA-binding MarR family transcriptional regulator